MEKERKKAAKKEAAIRAREAEMEEEIRVLEEEKRHKAYNRNALAGMTVEHSLDKFTEGRDVVMTLKVTGPGTENLRFGSIRASMRAEPTQIRII